jgi:L-threonylcarbamoyladenylate synthase
VSGQLRTAIWKVDPDRPDPAALDAGARVLLEGGLVAFATETVYGLGAVAVVPRAVEKIFAAKGRPAVNPLIVHVDGISSARACFASWPEAAESLARRFWPGPLTLIQERSAKIPEVVTAGKTTVAVRVPAGKIALGLIERVGQPLAAPSANRSNRISPTRAEHVVADLDGLIDLVIDSGPTALGLESTVLDLTSAVPRILRLGPISKSEIEQALGGRPVVESTTAESSINPSSPGQMAVHYAPQTPSFHVDGYDALDRLADRAGLAVVVFGEQADVAQVATAGEYHLDTPEVAARELYGTLHECDALGRSAIIVVLPPDEPRWRAVLDRLLRATRPISERV